jgi:hypothetical protein
MQIASQTFPFFEVPNWAVRLVVLLLIIGFPVALILAWGVITAANSAIAAAAEASTEANTMRTGGRIGF